MINIIFMLDIIYVMDYVSIIETASLKDMTMAHLVETMAYAGEVPWHGLGKPVHNDLTPAQMLKEAGLDWTVRKIPSYIHLPGEDTTMQEVALDTCALVRSSDNKILSEISSDWNPLQNEQAFEFFNEYIMAGDMEMHTAGSLKGGRIVWALAKVKESFEVFGEDRVDSYLLFSNPHEYGKSIDVRFTPIRVVCNNTLSLSLSTKSKNVCKVSHHKKFDAEQVKEAMGIAHYKLDQYKEMALALGSKKAKKDDIVEYFKSLFPNQAKDAKKRLELSRNALKALEVIDTQPGAKFAKGTWWQAFNAVTFMVDHEIGHNDDSRMTSAWYGPGAKLKSDALELALEKI